MLEYYRVFGVKLKPLPPEPQLSDYYNASDQQKSGKLLFVIAGTAISSYIIMKYLKNKWTRSLLKFTINLNISGLETKQ